MSLARDIARLEARVEAAEARREREAEAGALVEDPAGMLAAGGLTPDPWQAELLRSDWQRALLLCTRQAGKSTTTAAVATHTAVFQPGSLTLIMSPSERQSAELYRKVAGFYHAIGAPVPAKAASALRLELANGSRIAALPGTEKSVRGFSAVDLLIVDEAARVLDELYYSVRPMLAVSGGRLVCLSTPWGKRGFFYHEWTEGSEDWHRVKVTAHDCPRISEAFLEEERRTLGDWWFRQEYLCEFVDTTDSVFRTDQIDGLISPDVQPLFELGEAA